MKSHVAVFHSQDEAMKAVELLYEAGFPVEKVSVIGNAHVINDHIRVQSRGYIRATPMLIGLLFGVVLGILTEWIKIPGLGFLDINQEAGTLTAVFFRIFFGFDLGIVIGLISVVITALIVRQKNVVLFKQKIAKEQHKVFVIINGTEEEIEKASEILHPNFRTLN
jgi:hypothetical protein